jgi:hypothetical protein
MTNARLDFGTSANDVLEFGGAARPLIFFPAAGGAQVRVAVRVHTRFESDPPGLYQVAATLIVSRGTATTSRLQVCELGLENVVQPGRDAIEIMLDGQIGDAQLRAIDALRDGADDIWVTLKIRATRIDHAPGPPANGQTEIPARFTSRSGELSFALASSDWLAQWKRAQSGTFLEVLLPLTGHPDYALAAGRIAQAQAQQRGGDLDAALRAARKAIEAVRRGRGGTLAIAKAALAKKDRRERTKDERWALFVEAAFDLLSGAGHDDPGVSENFEWSRPEADTLIAATAGLLGQLAHDNSATGAAADAAVLPITDLDTLSTSV